MWKKVSNRCLMGDKEIVCLQFCFAQLCFAQWCFDQICFAQFGFAQLCFAQFVICSNWLWFYLFLKFCFGWLCGDDVTLNARCFNPRGLNFMATCNRNYFVLFGLILVVNLESWLILRLSFFLETLVIMTLFHLLLIGFLFHPNLLFHHKDVEYFRKDNLFLLFENSHIKYLLLVKLFILTDFKFLTLLIQK